ncbi:hypothetical protein ACFLRR_03585, partial [Bacteroidota bacterium]
SSKVATLSTDEIDEYWKTGKTLPVEVTEAYPLPPQDLENDNGINVLVDLAHDCSFATLWNLQERLNKMGFRTAGSHATINTVLDPEGFSRVRIPYDTINKIFPFAWWPNAEYNVIITEQNSLKSQEYTTEEIQALLNFVNNGGGLLIQGKPAAKVRKQWSLNTLCSEFGCMFTTKTEEKDGYKFAVLDISEEWEIMKQSDNGLALIARRMFGKGRIMINGDLSSIKTGRKDSEEKIADINKTLNENISWLAGSQEPVGGEACLPQPMWGGGGIYPELEGNFSGIVFYYAANQKPELLKTVTEDVPIAQEYVQKWLPSKPTDEPMYLLLAAGGGGGWAVNAYKPKENGIISLDPYGILSIFAHELAHTMHGPVNNDGIVAGNAPIPNRGEAHAGWFQGKVNAIFKPEKKDEANRNCNSVFDYDPQGNQLDLATHYENKALNEKWGKGKDWTKTWYMWQKLDDRYGPTWYPRWKWVQHTRWKNDPEHKLSWDEMVEDMSIAVGEDLFPFITKLGTTLNKSRLESIEFLGEIINLSPAPIEVTRGGPVRLDEIGDYTKPIIIEN